MGVTCGCFGEGGTEGRKEKREGKNEEREDIKLGRAEQGGSEGRGGRWRTLCACGRRVRFRLPGEAVLMTGKCEIWRVGVLVTGYADAGEDGGVKCRRGNCRQVQSG